ncbi:hypothetical protein RHSIM_Rhsim02G0148100 [Rhododendron simsii]|uniref:Transcription repressor n=1 Tax=Rhododendron simsii TaxID=118357 RepID=A0A834LXA7_RHOSS|nr:hypothetical protein RHSIM_Rhsim02G0148100 [Rhododendron simsii]
MMKWGRKKAEPSSSPSHNSSISYIFPTSWISKFKLRGSKNSEPKPVKEKQKANTNTPSNWRGGRFYGKDDESYWRLSFGDERVDGETKSRGGLRSVRHNSNDELDFASSSCQSCRGGEGLWKFNDMVSDIRKAMELPEIVEVEKEEKWKEFEEPRRKSVRGEKSRKTSRRVLEEKREGLERKPHKAEEVGKILKEGDVFELLESMRINRKVLTSDFGKDCNVSSLNSGISGLKTIDEDCGFKPLSMEEKEEEMGSERRKLKEIKIQEVLSKNEKQRKSFHTSRKGGRVRAYSPRTVARIECKIKAIEDMRRTKMKTKRKTEAVGRSTTGFDSFAVVKSSVDPQRDFRCSMIEMITEKGIRRSEELEELLACYLTLNADEYHDVIIKVFRQVWFELNQEYFIFSPESQNELT